MRDNEEQGTEVTVPHLAESLVSATVIRWLKRPGDMVKEYDILCELLTDKVTVEMPSPLEGKLLRIVVQEGETAAVGAPICIIQEGNTETAPTVVTPPVVDDGIELQMSPRYSPAVLYLAEEYRIDLRKVKGTGLGGRITRKDVLAYIKQYQQPSEVTPTSKSEPKAEPRSEPKIESLPDEPLSESAGKDEFVPVSLLRSIIASRMRQSVSEIPHAWLMIEADVSNMVSLREKWKARFLDKEGVHLTYIPFVLKAIINAIKDYPIVNSTWAQDKIIIKKEIHISVAVGSEESVVTPVIKHADHKTIAGLAIELDDIIKRTRSGKLTLNDMQGGTITFNNTGSFGSVLSNPIINYPQAAIITLESIVRRPVAIQDLIGIRHMANLCLSLDHRVLDGMICGRFMQRVKHYLEQYDLDTVIY